MASPVSRGNRVCAIATADSLLGTYVLYCEGQPRLLFTENETSGLAASLRGQIDFLMRETGGRAEWPTVRWHWRHWLI